MKRCAEDRTYWKLGQPIKQEGVRYNDNRKYYKYVSITTNQPDTKYTPDSDPTTTQHAVVSTTYSHRLGEWVDFNAPLDTI